MPNQRYKITLLLFKKKRSKTSASDLFLLFFNINTYLILSAERTNISSRRIKRFAIIFANKAKAAA